MSRLEHTVVIFILTVLTLCDAALVILIVKAASGAHPC